MDMPTNTEAKYIPLLIKDDKLLKKNSNKSGIKFAAALQNEFDREPTYNDEYIKIKVKSYNDNINTDFHNNGMYKDYPRRICFSVILIDSVFNMGEMIIHNFFKKKIKYVVKERNMKGCFDSDYELKLPLMNLINLIILTKKFSRRTLKQV